jgi:hypothetical protein
VHGQDDMAELASGIKQNSLRLERELREASKVGVLASVREGVCVGGLQCCHPDMHELRCY